MDKILGRLFCGSLEDVTLKTSLSQYVITLSEQRPVKTTFFLPIPDEVWLPPDVWQSRVETLARYMTYKDMTVLCALPPWCVTRSGALCGLSDAHWDAARGGGRARL